MVDAFSGAGEYSDGLEGSPIVFAQTFLQHTARATFHGLDVICLDERADRLAHLSKVAAKLPQDARLRVKPLAPGRAGDRLSELSTLAHNGNVGRPVLWILDPYGWADVPVDMALACLKAGPRDEIIISLFTEEMYRFSSDITKQDTLTRVIGGDHWRGAVRPGAERSSKEGLADAYCKSLFSAGLHTGKFAVAARGHMPRYHLIYATHRQQALAECWNPTKWYLDKYGGGAAGPADISGQGDLFDLLDDGNSLANLRGLRYALESHAGHELTFRALMAEATALGFKVTHLRQELSAMRKEALAIRVDTDAGKSEWPEGCVIRFYKAVDND